VGAPVYPELPEVGCNPELLNPTINAHKAPKITSDLLNFTMLKYLDVDFDLSYFIVHTTKVKVTTTKRFTIKRKF
jgi:hypothetical protein